jgi:hypothetical protein
MNHFSAKNGTLGELVAQISEYLVEGELAYFVVPAFRRILDCP